MSLIKTFLKIKRFERAKSRSCVQHSFFDETFANSLANDLPLTWVLYADEFFEVIEPSQNINKHSESRSKKHEPIPSR